MNNRLNFAIAVDFDGTIAQHYTMKPVPGAFKWMKKFQKAGAQLILYTMRDRRQLLEAIEFCSLHGIFFDGHNRNPQQGWTTSPKCYAQVHIDDAGVCVPLIEPEQGRAYVDWKLVGPAAMKKIKAHKRRIGNWERLANGLGRLADKLRTVG